jgi:hypothetical protein
MFRFKRGIPTFCMMNGTCGCSQSKYCQPHLTPQVSKPYPTNRPLVAIPSHSRWFILFTLAKGGPQHHDDDATGLVQLRPIYLDNPHKHIQNASCCSSSSSRECSNKLSLRNSYAIQKSITSQVSRVSNIIYGNHYTRRGANTAAQNPAQRRCVRKREAHEL